MKRFLMLAFGAALLATGADGRKQRTQRQYNGNGGNGVRPSGYNGNGNGNGGGGGGNGNGNGGANGNGGGANGNGNGGGGNGNGNGAGVMLLPGDAKSQYIEQVSLNLDPKLAMAITGALDSMEKGIERLPRADVLKLAQTLLKSIDAKCAVSVGDGSGMDAVAMAMALPDKSDDPMAGVFLAANESKLWDEVGSAAAEAAGVADKIDTGFAAPTEQALHKLVANNTAGHWDFCFIDSDQLNYTIMYYEQCMYLIRKGGQILVDNTFWHNTLPGTPVGQMAPLTVFMHQFNKRVQSDERAMASQTPTGDGVTIVTKIKEW